MGTHTGYGRHDRSVTYVVYAPSRARRLLPLFAPISTALAVFGGYVIPSAVEKSHE